MPISLTSPNAFNYYSGGGGVSIKLEGDADYMDAGYVQSFEVTPKATILDHFNARTGIRQKDMSIVTEISAEVAMTMEEWTARNLSLALLGIQTDTPGTGSVTATIQLFAIGMQIAAIKFQGFNSAGPQWTVELPTVQMSPNKALQFIMESKWGQIAMNGSILGVYDTKSNTFDFGTATATFPDGSLRGAEDTWPRAKNGQSIKKNGNGNQNPGMPGRAPGTPSGEAIGPGTPNQAGPGTQNLT